jgi:hypothetical protein
MPRLTTMRLPIAFILVSSSLVLGQAPPKVRVTGSAVLVRQVWGRWGGAAPSPEELERERVQREQAARPMAMTQQTLIFRPGKTNRDVAAIEVHTDAAGNFSVDLTPGPWCVVETTKRAVDLRPDAGLSAPSRYTDPACLAHLRAACDTVLTITAEPEQMARVVVTRKVGGAPECYFGPSPPSAPPKPKP